MSDATGASRDELPLPDFDHLPIGSVESRVRTLDADGVQTLLDYERAHGDRLPVVQVLQARLGQLEQGAEPTGGSPTGFAPEVQDAPPTNTGKTSQASRETQGPPVNAPSHGDPTNPH